MSDQECTVEIISQSPLVEISGEPLRMEITQPPAPTAEIAQMGVRGLKGDKGDKGDPGSSDPSADPGELNLIFENKLL